MSATPRITLSAIVLLVGLAFPAAAETPLSSVDSLTVTRSGNTITAEGLASIADASDSEVGTDPTGDAKYQPLSSSPSVPLAGLGMDLTSARIRHSGTNGMLTFTLAVADPIDQTFTAPEAIAYHWLIKVTNGASEIYYQLQAMRSGQYERTLPSADPLFRVNSCGSLSSGAPNCFEVAGIVDGSMSGGLVQWHVPVALIGAFDGAEIQQSASGSVRSLFSASGAAYVGGGGDSVETTPYVVAPSVHVAVHRANLQPAFRDRAALGPDGTFVGKMRTPSLPGSYVVSVRACHGDIRGCAVRSTSIEI